MTQDLGVDDLAEHSVIGRYRVVQRLGEGGMGVVHLALDRQGRAVALKVLRSLDHHDTAARARLRREVDALRRITSAHVATKAPRNQNHGPRLSVGATQGLRDGLTVGCGPADWMRSSNAPSRTAVP